MNAQKETSDRSGANDSALEVGQIWFDERYAVLIQGIHTNRGFYETPYMKVLECYLYPESARFWAQKTLLQRISDGRNFLSESNGFTLAVGEEREDFLCSIQQQMETAIQEAETVVLQAKEKLEFINQFQGRPKR